MLTKSGKRATRAANENVRGAAGRAVPVLGGGASEALYRALLCAVLDPTIAIDGHGTVVTASDSVQAVFGWKPDELVGRNINRLLPEPHKSMHDDYLANYRRTGITHILGRTREFEVVHKDGHCLSCELSVARGYLPGAEGSLFIGSFRDVTERNRAQRAETAMLRGLATIGEQAAMLAHEIKNPIAAVNVALRAVAHVLGEDHRAVLGDLVARMQRIESLMRRTLTFARPLELKLARTECKDLFEQTLRQLRSEIVKRGARVSWQVSDGCSTFSGDRQLLEEVLTNLLTNALEAIGPGGQVALKAHSRPQSEIMLSVDDDGPGIPPSLRTTLFKPFATTKATGTGLGLAFSRKVIEDHGGTLEVRKSELGGARFEIRLPAVL